MCNDLDGRLVLNDCRNAMLGAGCRNGVCAHRPHTQRHDANGSAEGHAPEDVALARVVRSTLFLQVFLDDLTLFAGVVNRWSCHPYAYQGHTHSEGDGDARHGRRCRGARDETGVVLPLALELAGVQTGAFCVVGLEVERHLADLSLFAWH